MAIPHYCKVCFKGLNGKHIPDSFLLMSGENGHCDNCEKTDGPVVVQYFKYGEQSVTSDGKHMKDVSRHVGVNPNYTFFGKESIYPEQEQRVAEN